MEMFACFAPSFAVKNKKSMVRSKSSNGSKKGSNKRISRVKPIDIISPSVRTKKKKSKSGLRIKPINIVSPTTVDGGKKRSRKWGLRVKPIDMACPSADKKRRSKWYLRAKPIDITGSSAVDGRKKRRSKWGLPVKPSGIVSPSAEDGSKKRRSKWGLRVKPVDIVCPATGNDLDELCLPVPNSNPSEEKMFFISSEIASDDGLARTEPTSEAAYVVGVEHDEIQLMKRDHIDLDVQPKGESVSHGSNTNLNNLVLEEKAETDEGVTLQAVIASGHAGDPWIERTTFMNSLVLKRSCSNIETKQDKGLVKSPRRSNSYSNSQNSSGNSKVEITYETNVSSLSVLTSHIADCVMLKRLSSSHVLPSRSRKIWRKLLLRSNSNLPSSIAPERLLSVLSDTHHEHVHSCNMRELDRRTENSNNKAVMLENHWIASPTGFSHMDRVNAWVSSLEDSSFFPVDVQEHCDEIEDEETANQHNLEIGESTVKKCSDTCLESEEIVQPNIAIQSLNSFSSVAHISSVGLKVVPSISAFVYLRSANLSGNCIVQITPGSLPKSLHTLDLSRNKISSIEGLRDLERLKVLNLSFNRITRIGHGLSSCTLIKELYLAGNKISVVEGLHRVLKLTLLDLSFNKITSIKALGQLVANYNCLLALNLIGNPIQANIGDDQLKKEVLSLLPHVTYLNKQSIKPVKVLEVPMNNVAKAALGDGPRRKITRRMSQGSLNKKKIVEGSFRTTKHRSKSMQSSPRRRVSS